jgi:hypothetical protein
MRGGSAVEDYSADIKSGKSKKINAKLIDDYAMGQGLLLGVGL